MSTATTLLRFMMAFALALAIIGATAATALAGPGGPMQAVFQGDDDGSGDDGRAFDPEPRPAFIHAGACAAPEDDVAILTSLTSPDGSAIGSDDRGRTEYSYTPQIPLTIAQLTDDDHVIIVELSELNDRVIACGSIGGVTDGNGSLVVNLSGDDDSDVYGVAVLTPNASNSGTTDASVFISGSRLGNEIGSRVDTNDRDDDNNGRTDVSSGRTGDDDAGGTGGGDDDGAGSNDDGGGGGGDDGGTGGGNDDGAGGGGDDDGGDD